jgi:hypothetical protein
LIIALKKLVEAIVGRIAFQLNMVSAAPLIEYNLPSIFGFWIKSTLLTFHHLFSFFLLFVVTFFFLFDLIFHLHQIPYRLQDFPLNFVDSNHLRISFQNIFKLFCLMSFLPWVPKVCNLLQISWQWIFIHC